ncbi:MAG TPA: hypothetical protein VI791_01690 [Patescibacteria group bacterium]|uniref:Protease PrsW n=1 Tax=Candidatus Gottesmanbacteria bacterium GW2011_GWB1_44_11c TaxID=1618447 RepID=A0A0G1GLZ6_9BACT|nr:MAG: hypothetical protein UW22_C0054G0010 [Candidatus Gottesmanbacteria bacterium GW2011_GWB1_44_11c]HLE49836.1 hypothetical protein [Patescibacteria group bacterium]
MDVWLIYLWSLIGPMAILLLLRLLAIGILLEEVFKGSLVIWLTKVDKRASVFMAMGIGLAYGFSELVLYSLNYWTAGMYSASLWRLLFTVPMHGVTTMFWFLGIKLRKVWLGALGALALHGLFNYLTGFPLLS